MAAPFLTMGVALRHEANIGCLVPTIFEVRLNLCLQRFTPSLCVVIPETAAQEGVDFHRGGQVYSTVLLQLHLYAPQGNPLI
jgi:hypothetical protein